ncbi:MAG TPA: hypothetical protein VNO33_07410 [Kofleriaceae bacterium]|nr:hypothetical protein [Kofleriaceae bacterium]
MRCGACAHEVVLNGACYFCGATALEITVKPVVRAGGEAVLIPAERLRRPRGPESSEK